jgi:hypothetical protein
VWAFFLVAGVQLIIGACAAALAVWLLAPARGARWATVGGSLVWLGAAIYGVGIGGWATLYYFVPTRRRWTRPPQRGSSTTPTTTPRGCSPSPSGGALLVALGSMLLALALWRARIVPRWIPIVAAVSAVTGIVLPPDTIAGIVGEAASSATAIAIGWYAWQRPGPRRRLRHGDETRQPTT